MNPSNIDPDDIENNRSDNPHLQTVLQARMHRRHLLRGGVGAMALAGIGPLALAACGGGDDGPAASAAAAPAQPRLGFNAVTRDLQDRLTVAPGYTATVIYATGDSIDPAVPDFAGDGTNTNFSRRAGDHHDAVMYFGLDDTGSERNDSGNQRALLAMNHENISGTVMFLHPNGQTNGTIASGRTILTNDPRPQAEAIKELEAHGVSIVEIQRTAGRFGVRKASAFNRRITARTHVELSGPVRGSELAVTRYSPDGTATRGTINNCAGGRTPWGTYLACEENWAGYFRRDSDAGRSPKELTALLRAGITAGRNGNYLWTTVQPADPGSTEFSRWNATVTGATAADDFRNAPNTFGYAVEIDPYDPLSVPRKRTAMGRFAMEGATCGPAVAGKPLAFYMGDDSRGEYLYKFVTTALWNPADAARGGVAVGNKYLDSGTLYVARCDANGTGAWLPLNLSNTAVASAAFGFTSLADVLVHTRLAADAAGGTKMDRPEWTAVNPRNGEVYVTMTENPDRGATTTYSSNNLLNPGLDAANPRYWLDKKGSANQKGNVNGHILRLKERGGDPAATTFDWDIFLFGAQARADVGLDDVNYQRNVNLSGLSDFNDLSKPDGCWFSPTTGILWIETDDNTYTDVSNCMLLACVPGELGDGGPVTIVNKPDGSPNAAVTTEVSIATRMGRQMTDATFKRFLTAPKGAEVTGITESPDGRTLFVNIQHPGENTSAATIGTPASWESHWPGNGGGIAAPYGPGGATARPRSATVMITKDDGGLIGL